MFQPIRFTVAISICLGLLVVSAHARDYFVGQKDPAAADKNPGTEAAPFKTIQAGVDKAQIGDTIYVKGGDYEEMVCINKPGNYNRPIILTAWKDDRVRIGYRPRPLPVAGKWEPVPGSKSWKVQLTKDVPEDFLVLLNQMHIVTFMQDSPVKDDAVSEVGAAGPAEILHPRLPLERIKQTVLVDLSKAVNRGLADEVDNDGKGGWSDQGPNADMREFKTGQRPAAAWLQIRTGPGTACSSPASTRGLRPQLGLGPRELRLRRFAYFGLRSLPLAHSKSNAMRNNYAIALRNVETGSRPGRQRTQGSVV